MSHPSTDIPTEQRTDNPICFHPITKHFGAANLQNALYCWTVHVASVVRGTKTLPSHTRRYADRHAIALNAHSATMQSQTHLLTYGWAHRHSPLESPRSFHPVLEGLGTSNGRLKLPFGCIDPLQIISQTRRRPYPIQHALPCHSLTAGHPVMTRHAAT